MAELASRVNTVIHIPKIDYEGYKLLITADAKSSALNKFKNHFAMRGVQFDIDKKATDFIAADSVQRDVGARSVMAILNENLLDAYRIVDDNKTYNRITLAVSSKGKLTVKYFKGERCAAPVFKKQFEEEDFSLARECSCEANINRFCDEFTQAANLYDVTDERLVYYYLQTACRFLADEVRQSERSFKSLIKLAAASKIESNSPAYKTTYDIICIDYQKRLEEGKSNKEEAKIKLAVFSHYYSAFKLESRRQPNAELTLTRALETAGKYYETPARKSKTPCAL